MKVGTGVSGILALFDVPNIIVAFYYNIFVQDQPHKFIDALDVQFFYVQSQEHQVLIGARSEEKYVVL
jgi:hypothetical protein